MSADVQPGEVWQHRQDCMACSTEQNRRRHAYVVRHAGERLVLVQDLGKGGRSLGDPYTIDRGRFGSTGKGGLGFVGHLVNNRVVPVTDDVRRAA